MEPRTIICNTFGNWYTYAHSKYKTVSERYQGDEEYIFFYRICIFITCNCTAVNHCVILSISYRVSRKTLYAFLLLISRPPKHVEVPSWAFFNTPFRVDFKTINYFIIRWNFDRDIAKILKGSHCKNQHFLFLNESRTWTLRISQDYSRALKSTH